MRRGQCLQESGQVAKNASRPCLVEPALAPQPKFLVEDDGGISEQNDEELKIENDYEWTVEDAEDAEDDEDDSAEERMQQGSVG